MAQTSDPLPGSTTKPVVPSGTNSSGEPLRSGSTTRSLGRFAPGTVLAGRYRIIGLLGKGGMGEVYRADDLTLDQSVALKFLPEKVAGDPVRLGRFYDEVRVARQISHSNVCRIYDIGQVEGQHFISMEYIDGEDLASLLRRIGRLPNDKAVEIARQMCAGLAAAHEKGVLHRDLKPANIMIDGQGKVRIADFGLARSAESLRDSRVLEGTPAYMAPEQFAGMGESVKTDLYSLGLVLYEMFTGKPAFKADNVSDLARLHRDTTPTHPSLLITDLDPMVERVILRCLEKDPAARPATALAVSAALPGGDPLAAALAAGETPSPEMVAAAGDEGALSRPLAWTGLSYILAALAIVVLLSTKTSILSWLPPPKDPDVLAERSRELIKELGYARDALDSASGYEQTDYVTQLQKTPNRWDQLGTEEPPGLVFWFRQSPQHLSSENFYSAGVVRPDLPPQTTPGMIGIQVDTQGRLVKLDAVPPEIESAASGKTETDWSVLFREAGLDPAKFRAVAPLVVPPVYADSRMAWDGVYPHRPDLPIHVEAAAAHGRPVFFRIFQPWNRPSQVEKPQPGVRRKVLTVVILVLVLAVIASALLLAWRNLKLKRGDRRGAFRLSFYLFLMEIVARILQAHFVPDLNEVVGLLWMITSRALIFAALVWIGYMALEPHIRRWWPHAIISWSRLLAGRLRDPRIGRDILVGGALGITVPLLDQVTFLIASRLGISASPSLAAAGSINIAAGIRSFASSLFTQLTGAVSGTMYMFLLFFLLRLVLRKEWLAASVFVVAVTLDSTVNAANPWVALPMALLVTSGLMLLLKRLGLIAVLAFIVFINLPESFPLTADFSLWYSSASVFILLLLSGLAIAAFLTTLAGKTPFAFDLLKE